MPAGRPRKIPVSQPTQLPSINITPAKRGHPVYYNDGVPDLLLQSFAEGDTIAIFCAKIGIGESTFHSWVKKYPEFAEAYNDAKTYAKAFYEQHLKTQALSQEKYANATQMMAIMNNRFREDYARNPNDIGGGNTNIYVAGNLTLQQVKDMTNDELKLRIDQKLKALHGSGQRIIDITPGIGDEGTIQQVIEDVPGDN